MAHSEKASLHAKYYQNRMKSYYLQFKIVLSPQHSQPQHVSKDKVTKIKAKVASPGCFLSLANITSRVVPTLKHNRYYLKSFQSSPPLLLG